MICAFWGGGGGGGPAQSQIEQRQHRPTSVENSLTEQGNTFWPNTAAKGAILSSAREVAVELLPIKSASMR